MSNLCSALVNLHVRAEQKEIEFPKSLATSRKDSVVDYLTEENLSKYLPPVLAILVRFSRFCF